MDVDPLGVDIGARIRARRIECRLKAKTLAAMLNVPSTTITAWEHGRVLPGARSLLLLGRALDTPAATFLVDPDINAGELATRILKLSGRMLPDLSRFLTLLEELERHRPISLSAVDLHFSDVKRPRNGRAREAVSEHALAPPPRLLMPHHPDPRSVERTPRRSKASPNPKRTPKP